MCNHTSLPDQKNPVNWYCIVAAAYNLKSQFLIGMEHIETLEHDSTSACVSTYINIRSRIITGTQQEQYSLRDAVNLPRDS